MKANLPVKPSFAFPDVQAAKNPGEVDKFLKGLDFNGDAEVDFQEFVTLVVALTCAAHSRFCKQ